MRRVRAYMRVLDLLYDASKMLQNMLLKVHSDSITEKMRQAAPLAGCDKAAPNSMLVTWSGVAGHEG